jgi:hypothetical protein
VAFFVEAENRGFRGKGVAVAASLIAMLACMVVAAVTPAMASGLDAVQYFYTAQFAAGSQSLINQPITPTTPTGRVLVIQTVSIYRFPASASTLQSFIAVTSGGRTGYFVMPDISGSGSDFYPAATANFTLYVNDGTHSYVNLYRTGGASYPAETDYITVSGYLTAN